ncbi:hypothetical protein SAMN03159405_05889, partial [Pseudomonas sp. NFACC44-2]
MLPLGCEAAQNLLDTIYLTLRGVWFWGRFAAQREQAPSPRGLCLAM